MSKKGFLLSFIILSILMASCGGGKTAQIWTDRPEFALYAELFNNVQSRYKVSVKYYENPGHVLENMRGNADIVVGSWLKNSSARKLFRPADDLFGANKLSRNLFYQKLLTYGRVERNQYLLPVSFNLPAIIFSKNKNIELENAYTISFDELKEIGKDHNAIQRNVYTKMGFSPLWNDDFLLTVAMLSGSAFRDASPLAWDAAALEQSMVFINNWTKQSNGGIQAVEDFTFKYFVEPPEKLIENDRILFAYMKSMDYLGLNEETRSTLDYRWVIDDGRIPVNEDIVFLGISKRAKNKNAAKAFIQWYFNAENQDLILEYCMANRINEMTFGICGGFSALTPVTEQVFPRFYPELTGRMPPSDFLHPPTILPNSWAVIKERVILPYLRDRCRSENVENVYPLERRLADWIRLNR